jgi:BCCT family betaine/carnitine transporter
MSDTDQPAESGGAPSNPEGTSYRVGQDNIRPMGLDIHNPVFLISSITIVLFVIFALAFQDTATGWFKALRPWLTTNLDWVFVIAANLLVIFCIVIAISPLGKIRIGGKDAKPEYSYTAWFAMLFAAGMGIGLMFFGVLEPVNHMLKPPLGVAGFKAGADAAANAEAARMGLAATIFHWGLHPWAIYAMVGLALAFFCYNRGLPLTLRSAFYPLFGDRVWGWTGHIIDTLAVFATLFGLATSLGFGAQQASAGLEYLFGIPKSDLVMIVLIVVITMIALCSVLMGLDGGVKRLSELNMMLALLLLVFVFAVGPMGDIITATLGSTFEYFARLPELSNFVDRDDKGFLHGWTTFYWAWWISWSPFVGMFIARVSKGRSVRVFIFSVLIVPTIVCIIWMNVFGGTAILQILNEGYMGVAETVTKWQPELSLFKMADQLPLTEVVSFIGIVLVVVFFVTSSDSGSLVIDTITAGGKIDAPVGQRVFWCTFEGLVAIALLMGGGLVALQGAAISTGLPFAIVLMLMCVSLWMGLMKERRETR